MLEEQAKKEENNQLDIESRPPYKRFPLFKDGHFRLVLFLVGLLGLEGLTLIIELIVMAVNPSLLNSESEEYIVGLTFINSARYVILFFAFLALLFPRLMILVLKFKNWKNVIIGAIFGLLLVRIDVVYSYAISSVIDLETNTNQLMAEQMIIAYPALSIMVLGLLGPICEEFTYRYGLFSFISKKSKLLAYIVVPIVFAFIHFDFTGNMAMEFLNLPSYLIAGVILSFVYDKYGFEGALTAHIVNNMFSCISVLIYG